MGRKTILHMLTPLRQMSPFDVNMALDAGYDHVIPYTDVALADVTGLVQDAIFSRPPDAGVSTGVFIAGRDTVLALDMIDAARAAMVPPFEISVFADPAGSFTTAAAMAAKVEAALKKLHGRSLAGTKVTIFGATGVVGYCTAVISAKEGADVTLAGHDGTSRVEEIAKAIEARFGVTVTAADGSTEEKKTGLLQETEVVLAAAKAGVRVISAGQLHSATHLLIAADVNAVPPSGIEGLAANAKADKLGETSAIGIGALTIGNLKYKTQSGLFKQMIGTEKPVIYDFQDAFALARSIEK
ncbi:MULTISPECIES: NAD(P)-dependent methylenetetrahydromethanopterin dehydrogenase [Rhizobium/Agrobacterium group]|uniref:NAD(P)-dependent methylenetetrahydromethanopterin dehydrogenase n=2 Tax=Neorhizobium TaxID=1525371 RepID=A0ABV0M1Z7_9HYPH|nr:MULTISPECIES: NAD(P)-dependent methylenetetrahydromethanopterin dehydrogenase [Rhizobium/Agrobacterium group]KGD96526.1 methylenetetrahydromethanopterin dehydrogenase [Rhizobium sp. YS-1r]MCC2611962.1 methylenetetrahydromethanopterin dehydrogenase [Neorhizobium petrolearium]WGI67123.1 methylenetetrahydromethanopterin dehydrogenase [Neorhizobium petrolearium]